MLRSARDVLVIFIGTGGCFHSVENLFYSNVFLDRSDELILVGGLNGERKKKGGRARWNGLIKESNGPSLP